MSPRHSAAIPIATVVPTPPKAPINHKPTRRSLMRSNRGRALKNAIRDSLTHCGTGQASGKPSGEGGIRTLGDLATTPVFETGSSFPQPLTNSATSDDAPENLAFCLAFLAKKSPDLALLVEGWETLPDAVRAGIVAMVKAASPRKNPNSKEAL